MGKFIVGNGQYKIYAKNREEAGQIFLKEMERVDYIKEKMYSLLTPNGIASENFIENASDENLHIEFNDETSMIFEKPENETTKGEVDQRSVENGHITYNLAYRYPDIQGHNADFRLAHEMGHLILNPSNQNKQVYNRQTNSRQVSGLIRTKDNGESFYGMQMQENAINLLAELGIRGEHSADDILTGKVDVSEFNLYKKADDLVKLLAVSMRNDFDQEMSFEKLAQNKIDSVIEHSDGTKEPANTFFYGLVNDSSIIENEFDTYMGLGAWRELDTAITQLHQNNISREKFDLIFQTSQDLIKKFANIRMQEKYKETINRDGNNIPSLENKMQMINEMVGLEKQEMEQGSIIQDKEIENTDSFSTKQRIARFLQKNSFLMKLPFVEKFVSNQLNVLLPAQEETIKQRGKSSRQNFLDSLSCRDLPRVQQMSNSKKIEEMKRKMSEHQTSKENDGR